MLIQLISIQLFLLHVKISKPRSTKARRKYISTSNNNLFLSYYCMDLIQQMKIHQDLVFVPSL